MYTCTDCEKIICNEHTFLGHDCLKRCSRCHASHDRAGRGAPPPPPGGGGGPLRDHQVMMEAVITIHFLLDLLVAQQAVAGRLYPGAPALQTPTQLGTTWF